MRKFLLVVSLSLIAAVANADTVILDVQLDYPSTGRYRLAGQSAFLQTRTTSLTSGGQLDGIESGGASWSYDELFPEPSLNDYLNFAYFGIIETLDEFDAVIDSSLIVAYASGSGVDETISDRFAFSEAQLVGALTTSFDSQEFFDFFDAVLSESVVQGEIAVPSFFRPGSVLDLVAFIGGAEGDVGVKVGTLGVTVVPEPGTFGMLLAACAALFVIRRRRG